MRGRLIPNLRLACSVWSGVPRGFSSASRRGKCRQLGRLKPLTTRSLAARAPRFKFVILTVFSALPGAWPPFLSYLLPCSSAPYCSSLSLLKLAFRVVRTPSCAAELNQEGAQQSAYVFGRTHKSMISSTNLTALTIVNSFSLYQNRGLI